MIFKGCPSPGGFAGEDSDGSLFGIFQVSILHNLAHLAFGVGILAGMWPFHSWSPTGHVAAPTAVSMLHAGVLMKLGAFGILRIAIGVLPLGAAYWAPAFAVLATVGIIY